MDLVKLQNQLLAAARSNPPSQRVPLAFEKRILAHLAGYRQQDEYARWAAALWRAAGPCVALMLLLGVWTYLASGRGSAPADLSQQFDQTVLVAVDQIQAVEPHW